MDWDRIAALYADRTLTVKEIARRFGVPASTISSRASREGWPGRRQTKDGPARKPELPLLIKRLYRALDRQLCEIEARLHPEEQPPERTAAERERDARTLSALIRTLEKLRELEGEAKKTGAKATGSGDDGEDIPGENMRIELERRLDRLLVAHKAAGVLKKPK